MRGQAGPELTDDDLRRLVRLGGDTHQIAEASGLDAVHVRRRLDPGDQAPPAVRGRGEVRGPLIEVRPTLVSAPSVAADVLT